MSPASSTDGALAPDPALVSQMLGEQVPDLAGLPIRLSPGAGSSNWVFRLADNLALRMSRSDDCTVDVELR